MLGVNFRSSASSCHTPPHLSLQSAPGNWMLKDVPNLSPRLPSYSNPTAQLERTSFDQSSPCCDTKEAWGFTSITSISSSGTTITKSSVELMKEIATLEVEIMHMERHLLSRYRTAFEQHLPALSDNSESFLQCKMSSPQHVLSNQLCYKMEPDRQRGGGTVYDSQTYPAHGWANLDNQSPTASKAAPKRDQKSADPGRRSLADHLGGYCIDNPYNRLDRLSIDIIRCISSIYCKLAHPSSTHSGFSASPTSSLSSSSIFSSQIPYDSCSPHYNEEARVPSQLQGLKEETGLDGTMVEVLKVCLDDDSFNYASRMLQNFRLLVRSLEKVDPRKMKREEKLAFWINIHNALVMHAYLAYGTHNHIKSTSVLKAAYNVGGHFINASDIQSSILGIQSHHSVPWLQTLLSPGKKYKMGSVRHIYALEYTEPLVHFALCSGAYSDPAVRVYKAENVFHDLRLAKEEFIRGTVYIHKGTKILLPKILCHFAEDMSLSMAGLLEVVKDCVSEVQRRAITSCMKGKPNKHVHWLPHNLTFRYVIHKEIGEGRIKI